MPNPFYVQPEQRDLTPLLSGIGGLIKENRLEKEDARQKQEVQEVISRGDQAEIANILIKYPKRSKEIKDAYGFKSKQTEQMVSDAYQRAITDPDNAKQTMMDTMERLQEMGVSTDNMFEDLGELERNPQAGIENLSATYAAINPKGWKAMQAQSGVGGLASAKTEILDSGAVIQALPSGAVQVRNPAGDIVTGDARTKVLQESRAQKKKTAIDTAADKQQVVGDIKTLQDIKAAGGEEAEKLKKQLKFKPQIEKSVIAARKLAAEQGDVLNDLARTRAAMPGLTNAVNQLKELSSIATSTLGGKVFDAAVKETGFGSTKGATARAKFIAIVNNQVLPLLKQTFGGSFSVQEGQELKASMGDPDATPEEKMAQLDAFIVQKRRDIEAKELQLSPQEETPESKQEKTAPQSAVDFLKTNPQAADQFKAKYGYLP